jgi:hypothetical protein
MLIRLLPKREPAIISATVISKLPFPDIAARLHVAFSNDATCGTYLEKDRWPYGFVCQYCKWHGGPCCFPGAFCEKCESWDSHALRAGQ